MERKQEIALKHWYAKSVRKPLVIRGARQVGKSTLVRQFADARGLKLFEVNLERHPSLRDLAETLDPVKILREFEFICNRGQSSMPGSIRSHSPAKQNKPWL